jgi:hypothetical protein
MLFNKKFLMGLSYIVGVLLILTFVLNLVMYVWAFFGRPPLALYDVTGGLASYYILLNKLVTLVFYYILVGGFAAIVKSSKLQEGFRK